MVIKEISDKKTILIDEINKNIEKYSKQSKQKFSEYIDSLGGKSTNGSTKNNIKTSLLSMDYKGYLRLLLLAQNSDKKLNRVADLIQLNLRQGEGYEAFKLSDYNTYLRVKSQVSLKYLFMTSAIMPNESRFKDNRYRIDLTLYKGY